MSRISCISFTCADADRLGAFYRDALGFEALEISERRGAAFSRLSGVDGAEARALRLRLGKQTIELLAFAKPGMPYPANCTSNDLRFHHIAIVAADMEAAYARLLQHDGWTAITRPAPQRLPDSSGGVTAFKFRDPEGHPLELLAFPAGEVPPQWQMMPARRLPSLGIDHSAIVVGSTARSVEFYRRIIGFEPSGGSLNRGSEQERLDGVEDAAVEVTALGAKPMTVPHLELLCYLSPAPPSPEAAKPCSNDIAATRLVIEVDDFPAIEQKLAATSVDFISAGKVTLDDGRLAALIRDPDGHALLLLG